MTHGSLFSGIGGFDLAAEWMGWENVFHCERNEFNKKILKQHFPGSIGYGDITETDFKQWNGNIDIISGGFPCQPFSTAGERKGDKDERHLWPEMCRAIREIQQVGLWVKTFSALLIGTGEWFSTNCRLTWKLRATKRSRFYFQLVPSMHHTVGTEFGLLPTPSATDHKRMVKDLGKLWDYCQRHQVGLANLMQLNGHTHKEIVEAYEQAMGYPIGWTELKPLETQ